MQTNLKATIDKVMQEERAKDSLDPFIERFERSAAILSRISQELKTLADNDLRVARALREERNESVPS